MIFKDRKTAGRLLAEKLNSFKETKDTLVIGIPRGGVVVAKEVADRLSLPLDVICPRKIGAPFNPEFAIGAVTETGEAYFDPNLIERLDIPEDYIRQKVAEETERAKLRLDLFRKNRPPRLLRNKTVILIDDGLATGATMKAAINSLRAEKTKSIIVAVPVAPYDTAQEIELLADQLFCILIEKNFYAVGQFYENFGQTTNDDVLALLSLKENL